VCYTVPVPERIIGIVGKTNVGKSTLFSAMTMIPVKIADHPFTTIEPNIGVAYVKKRCVHVELGLTGCNPRTGFCVKGFRFIPVKVMDVAGLVPGAHRGRGLGNKFMDDLRQADVLIHVVDAAGSTDLDGNRVKPGSADPVEEAKSILFEINEWFKNVIVRIWENKISRTIVTAQNPVEVIYQNISGLNVKRAHVIDAIRQAGLDSKHPKNWSLSDVVEFSLKLREVSKPIIVAANKADFPEAKDNVKRLIGELGEENVVPVSALAELIIRKASQTGLVDYVPGDADFEIRDPAALTREQLKVLEMIRESVLKPHGSTGVQELLRRAVFDKLKLIAVYPVADESRLSDHSGNVLPDAYLVERGTTIRELAYSIHTALGEGFLYAIDAKRRRRVGESYVLADDDVVKIVSTLSR